MKPLTKRIGTLLLCLLLSLTACTADPAPTGTEPGAERGRYVEQEIPLPQPVGAILGIDRMADGTIYLIGMRVTTPKSSGFQGEYAAWSSADNGRTWQEESYAWMDALNDDDNEWELNSGTFVSPDVLYLYIDRPDSHGDGADGEEEDTEEGDEPAGDGEEDAEDDQYSSFFSDEPSIRELYRADRNGMELLPSGSWEEFYPDSIKAMGDYLLLNRYENSALIDPATGRELYTLEVKDDLIWGSYTLLGDSLLYVQPSGIREHGLTTGEELGEYAYTAAEMSDSTGYSNAPEWLTVLAPAPEGDALYYCNATGIYRMLTGSGVTERLVDGDLSSLTLPTLSIKHLFAGNDGSFLVICRQDYDTRLFLYEYDETVHTVPSNEISVYSLNESLTIRQAMGQFQQRNPDVKINYRVGRASRERGGDISYDDALRTFTTELLAGNGPDVLILDDLPIESYMEKGVLEDLTPLLDGPIASGELYANIADTYLKDGKRYAVPARFWVPMIQGVGIESIRDVNSLARHVSGKQGNINTEADFMMQRFFPICAPGWFRLDGSLDEAAVMADLADLKSIADPVNQWEGYVFTEESSLAFGATAMKGRAASVGFGYLVGLSDLSGPYSLMEETGQGSLELFPRMDGGGAYVPRCILGVTADSSKPELSRQFVDFVLSDEILSYEFNDGLPANITAMEKAARFGEDRARMTVGGGYDNPDTGESDFVLLLCSMPEEPVVRDWIRRFASLDTPLTVDAAIQQLVIDETDEYFRDQRTLEETMDSLKSKLTLRSVE